jgi:hypothetical protein
MPPTSVGGMRSANEIKHPSRREPAHATTLLVVFQFAVAAAVGESTSLTDGAGIATKYHGKLEHYHFVGVSLPNPSGEGLKRSIRAVQAPCLS